MRGLRLACAFGALAFGAALAAPAFGAEVEGLSLHSTTTGSGPTIIFVHGWTCDDSSWAAQVPAFSGDYQVITLDLPGHGQSASPAQEDFSMDLFAAAVEAVRAEAGAEKVVLVGHSMGAVVIREYALDYPEHVAGLVAVDGPLDVRPFASRAGAPPTPTPEARETMIRGMFIEETPAALQEQILSMMLGTPEATAHGAMAAVFNPALLSDEVIEAPALSVVAGTGNVPDTEAAEALIPNWEATQVAGTAHFLMMEKPDEFNRLLTEFIEEKAQF